MKNKIRIYANFKRDSKWLGIIDYKILSIFVSYVAILVFVLKYINLSLELSFYVFMIFITPVVAVFCVSAQNEYCMQVIYSIFKFCFTKGIYIKTRYYENNVLKCRNLSKTKIKLEK